MNVVQAYGICYKEISEDDISPNVDDVINQEEIARTAKWLLENSDQVELLLDNPEYFRLENVKGQHKILNLSDPVELAKRIGVDVRKQRLLRTFFSREARIFSVAEEYV